MHLHHVLGTSQVWAHALICALAGRHGLQLHYWGCRSLFRPFGVRVYPGCGMGCVPPVPSVSKHNTDCNSLSSQVGLTHHWYVVNLNDYSFRVLLLLFLLLFLPHVFCNLRECQCACCIFNMYQWCRACLWQTLTTSCVNTCPHLNKTRVSASQPAF